MIDDVIGDGHK